MKKTTTKILGIGLAIAMAVMPLEGTVVHAAGENPVAAQETVIDTGKCGENATYQVSGNEVDGFIVYISGSGRMYDYLTHPIDRSMYSPWNSYRDKIREVHISGVTNIGGGAFYECKGLEKVDISFGVNEIGEHAFAGCINLQGADVPDSVTSIGMSAFYGCVRLSHVRLGQNLKYIGSDAFYDCRELFSVTIPETVEDIGQYAFGINAEQQIQPGFVMLGKGNSVAERYAQNSDIPFVANDSSVMSGMCGEQLVYSVSGTSGKGYVVTISGNGDMYDYTNPEDVPWYRYASEIVAVNVEGARYIGNHAFYDCVSLRTVSLGKSVQELGEWCFYGCTAIEDIEISNIQRIGKGTFAGCISMNRIILSNGLTAIEEGVFASCYQLREIILPETVVSIGRVAFNNCDNLVVSIPASVKSIDEEAFSESHKYTICGKRGSYAEKYAYIHGIDFVEDLRNRDIVFSGKCGENALFAVYGNREDGFRIEIDGSGEMTDFSWYGDDNSTDSPWDYMRENIVEIDATGISTIGAYAFYQCPRLVKVSLADSIRKIGFWSFSGCQNLAEINMPSELEEIDEVAFSCTSLEKVIIPANTAIISAFAFQGCDSLQDIVILSKEVSVGEKAFLMSNDSDASDMFHRVFYGYSNSTVQDLTRDYGAIFCPIDDSFVDCGHCGLSSFYVLQSAQNGFRLSVDGTDKMDDYLINDSLQVNSPWWKYGEKISSVNVSGVTRIGNAAFAGLSNLCEISIEEGITEIGNRAFDDSGDVASFVKVSFPKSLKMIPQDVFGENTDNIVIKGYFGSMAHLYATRESIEFVSAGLSDSIVGKCGDDASYELSFTQDKECILTISGTGRMYDYSNTNNPPWSEYAFLIDEIQISGVTYIGAYSFCFSNVKHIAIGESVVEIGEGAFSTSNNLEEIAIPGNVKRIGRCSFFACAKLQRVNISEGVEKIGDNAFADSPCIKVVFIPKSARLIGGYAIGYYFENGVFKVNEGFSITGYEGSMAEVYSAKYSLPFTSVGKTQIDLSGECGNNSIYTLTIDEKKLFTLNISGTGNMYDYSQTDTLPPWFEYREFIDTIEINGVNSVGDFACYGTDAEYINFGPSVERIGKRSFISSNKLQSVTIPNNIIMIDEGAFSYCASLTEITIPNSVTMIGRYAFYDCTDLRTVILNEGTKEIGEEAFCNTNLQSVTIPESVEEIGEYALGYSVHWISNDETWSTEYSKIDGFSISGYDNSAAELYAIENGFEFISVGTITGKCGENASYTVSWDENGYCTLAISGTGRMDDFKFQDRAPWYAVGERIDEVNITGISYIGACAFELCSVRRAVIDNTVVEIGDGAFLSCSNLDEITIPESVKRIGDSSFSGCDNLQTVVLAESVEEIGAYAFHDNQNFKEITIPESVKNIGEQAFGYCWEVSDNGEQRTVKVDQFVINGYTNSIAELYAKREGFNFKSIGSAKPITGKSGENSNYTISIDQNGYCKLDISGQGKICNTLEYIIPRINVDEINIVGISNVGWRSFAESTVKKVTIDTSVEEIGDAAFSLCRNLNEIVIPKSVKTIGNYVFLGCFIQKVVLSEGLESVGFGAFADNAQLTEVTIPRSVKYIGDIAFGFTSSGEKMDGFIIKGYKETAAETYAKENGITFIALDQTTLATPVLGTVSSTATGVSVSWSAVEGAERYKVFRKVAGGSWVTVGTTTGTSIVDTKAVDGTTYTYTVACVNEAGKNVSGFDKTGKTITYKKTVSMLATPVLGTVSSTSTGVSVSWSAVEGAERYKVFRKVAGGSWVTVGTTTGTSIIDTKAVDGTTYTYTVACVNEAGKNVSGFDKTGKTITYKKPVSMLATPVLGTVSSTETGVSVSWNAVEGAARYKVFRKVAGGSWVTVGTTTGTSIIDTKAVDGTTYTYTVACVNEAGKNVSGFDKTGKTITYKKPTSMLATPVLGTVSSTATGVSVSWSAVEGAERYKVFRKVSGENWVTVGTTTGTSIIDTKAVDGTTYTYTVACVNEAGKNVSGFDKTGKTITYKKPTSMLATPVLGEVSSTATGVKITWSAVEGAERYKVFRKVAGENWVTVGTTTGTSIIDTKAVDGTTYTYTVACVNETGKNVSGFDKTGKTITFKKPTSLLDTPVLGTVRSTETGVSVSWSAVEGAERYKVFRKVAGENWVTVGTTTGTSIIDTKAVDGTTYTYTVACVNEAGKNVSGFDKTGKTITYKKPTSMLATPVLGTVSSTSTGVSVSWSAVVGAERYKVFRKVAGENWVTVGTTTGTSIIDTKAVKGTTYIYTVRCISADGKTNTSDFDHTGIAIMY